MTGNNKKIIVFIILSYVLNVVAFCKNWQNRVLIFIQWNIFFKQKSICYYILPTILYLFKTSVGSQIDQTGVDVLYQFVSINQPSSLNLFMPWYSITFTKQFNFSLHLNNISITNYL